MLLEDVFHKVEAGFEGLGRYLFKPDPLAPLRNQIADLTLDLHERHEALRKARQKLCAAEQRLTENQQTVVLLSSRIELAVKRGDGPQAYHLALEVDRLRQEIVQDHERVPRYEQTVWSLEFKIKQKVRELARLQEQLYGIPEVQRA